MSENVMREVRFDIHCKTCKYEKLEETKDPCNICLEKSANKNSNKPYFWKEK